MGWEKITTCFGVLPKCRQWTNPQTIDAKKMRGILLGFVFNITFAEIIAYKILKQDVVGGHLSRPVPDLMIISVSCLEALAAPLVAWWGSRRRRLTLALWMTASFLGVASWYALPDHNVRSESEFCDANDNETGFSGMTTASGVRLAVVALTASVFALSRAAVWGHCIALLDECAPERITVHYGIVINVRVVSLLLGYRIFTSLADTNFSMQITVLLVSMLPGLMQVPFVVPKRTTEELAVRGNGFLESVARVCNNGVAMAQMLSLALLAAALWGYGYYDNDIVRAKFLINEDAPESDNFVNVVQCVLIFCILMFAASRFSAPLLAKYCRRKAMGHVVFMSVLVVALFAGLQLPRCDHGAVAGLGDHYYGHPDCSFQCGCQPRWEEFSPVCAPADMVTYLSPCHAGCAGADTVNSIRVFSNCSCASGGRALAGSCAEHACRFALNFHRHVRLVLTMVLLLAFQAQAVLVLKSVERRDRSVAAGLTLAVVAAVAFVAGPLIYLGIDAGSCRWFEGDKCHLFTEQFPKTVGYTSTFITVLAAMLCIVTLICVRVADRQTDKPSTETPAEDVEVT